MSPAEYDIRMLRWLQCAHMVLCVCGFYIRGFKQLQLKSIQQNGHFTMLYVLNDCLEDVGQRLNLGS